MDYLIGQRVIYHNEIVVVCDVPDHAKEWKRWSKAIWIKRPSGMESHVQTANLSPLPNGQL